jgi:serine/threonine protein kinase
MAELFSATVDGEHGFARNVVIKRLLPHLAADPGYTAMFIDEAKLTARLVHPKIAQTYELGRVGEQLFIAMEMVDGVDVLAMLRELAQKHERMPVDLAVWVAHETLDALEYAHTLKAPDGAPLGVVHRDISPSNILLSRRGDVKLVDFGIARATEKGRHHRTKSGTLKGKYGYMSPEQVMELPIDARSDLFSVGIVFAEMLCGRRLFAAAAELDVLLMVRDARLARLDEYGKHIDKDLDGILRKALKKDTAERWQSAGEMRDALDEWLFQQRLRVTPKRVSDVVDTVYEQIKARRKHAQDQMGDIGEESPPAAAISSPAVIELPSPGGAGPRAPTSMEAPRARRGSSAGEEDGIPRGMMEVGDSMPIVTIEDPAAAAVAVPAVPIEPATPVSGGRLVVTIPPLTEGERAKRTSVPPAIQVPPVTAKPVTIPPPPAEPPRSQPTAARTRPPAPPAPRGSAAPPDHRTELAPKVDAPLQRQFPRAASADDELEAAFAGLELAGDVDEDSTTEERLLDLDDDRTPVRPSALAAAAVATPLADQPSVRYSSIEAAVSALSRKEPDPSTVEFDGASLRRHPTDRVHLTEADLDLAAAKPPPALADIEDTPEENGDFAITPPLRVLYRVTSGRLTGLLVATVGAIKKEIYVRDGMPEYVTSNISSELFGNWLVQQGVLSQGELAMALAMMPHYSGKLGDTLVGLGLLKPLEVFRHLTRQVRQKLIDVCTWGRGNYSWYGNRTNEREAFPLDLNAFEVLGAGAMAIPSNVVDAWVDKWKGVKLRATKGKFGPDRFEIPGLRAIYDGLDGKKPVEALLSRWTNEGERRDATRMMMLLEMCDLARPS